MRTLNMLGALSCIVAVLLVAPALGEQQADKPADKPVDSAARAPAARAMHGIARSSQVIGMTIQNAKGEEIGHVEDVVVDLASGKIRYAAMAFGGFLGFNEKLFAMPWQGLEIKTARGDADQISRVVLYNVTQEQLEKAPGFPSNNWPAFADARWREIDRYYAKDKPDAGAPRENGAAPRENGAAPRKEGEAAGEDPSFGTVFRASSVVGMEVKNERNQQLGSVSELVFDLDRANVRYVAMSYGGLLGVGDKLFAVPMSKLKLAGIDATPHLQANIAIETLKNAEGFDESNWPNTADPRWSEAIDKYYGTTPKTGDSTESPGVEIKP